MKVLIEFISKHGLKLTLSAAVISIVMATLTYMSTDSAEGFIDIAYGFVIIAILAAVVLPILSSVDNPKSFLKIGAGLVTILVVFGVCWAISDNQSSVKAAANMSANTIQFSDTLITSTKFMLVIAIIGVLYTELKTLFK